MKKVELRVSYHTSGNFTLTEKIDDEIKRDCEGDLFTNSDKGSFYKAVAKKMADLQSQGFNVSYFDTAS